MIRYRFIRSDTGEDYLFTLKEIEKAKKRYSRWNEKWIRK